jgi:hypothetical protein
MVFVTFLPNRIHAGRGDLLNIVMSMAARAQWVAETFYGDDWQANRGEHGRSLATPALLEQPAPVEEDEAAGEASSMFGSHSSDLGFVRRRAENGDFLT